MDSFNLRIGTVKLQRLERGRENEGFLKTYPQLTKENPTYGGLLEHTKLQVWLSEIPRHGVSIYVSATFLVADFVV